MHDPASAEPSDEALLEFAHGVLGEHTTLYSIERDDLRETVLSARDLWRLLYRVSNGELLDAPP